MQIEQAVTDFQVLLPTGNTTNNVAPALTDVLAASAPSDPSVLNCGAGGSTKSYIQICPYGRAAAGVLTVYVFGWSKVRRGVANEVQWHPVLLCQFNATLSAALTGVAGGLVTNLDFYADTIADPAAGAGTINVDCEKKSPGSNRGGQMMVDVSGYERVQVFLQRTTATEVNALYRFTTRR
jgi:hypothetical protein